MRKRTIPTAILGATLAVGLFGACSSGTDEETQSPTATAVESTAPAETATAEPTEEATGGATEEAVEMRKSAMTLEATGDEVSGRLVVAGTDEGVADETVTLVFRPTGGGDVTTATATTGADGAFSIAGAGAGTWTASFLGTAASGPAAATATAS